MGAEPPSSGTELDADGGLESDVSPRARRMLAEETRTANGIYGIIVGSAVLVSVHGSTVAPAGRRRPGDAGHLLGGGTVRTRDGPAHRAPRRAGPGPSCVVSCTTGGSW